MIPTTNPSAEPGKLKLQIHGHAFVQNPRRLHYELGVDVPSHHLQLGDELADVI